MHHRALVPFALVSLLLAAPALRPAAAQQRRIAYDRWTEIFAEGRKIGWAHEALAGHGNRYTWQREEHSLAEGPTGPDVVTLAEETADAELRLLSGSRRVTGPFGEVVSEVRRTGDRVRLEVRLRGGEPRVTELTGDVDFTAAGEVRRLAEPLAPGRSWSMLQLDPFGGVLRTFSMRCVGEDPQQPGVFVCEDGAAGEVPGVRAWYARDGRLVQVLTLTEGRLFRECTDQAAAADFTRPPPADVPTIPVVSGNTFRDPGLGLTFDRPGPGWIFNRDARRGAIVFCGAEDGASGSFVMATILVGLPAMDLSAFRNLMMTQMNQGDRDFHSLGERTIACGQTSVVRIDGTDELAGQPFRGRLYVGMFAGSGAGYFIECWAPEDLIDRITPAFDRFEASLRLEDPLVSSIRTDERSYENGYLGFRLPIPAGWTRFSVQGSQILGLQSPEGARFTVEARSAPQGMTLADLRQNIERGRASQGARNVASSEVTVAGEPSLRFTYELSAGQLPIRAVEVAVVHRGRLITLLVAAPAPMFDRASATFDQLVAGFERLR